MKGFMNANMSMKTRTDRLSGNKVYVPASPAEDNARMEKAGFTIDRENGIYKKEGYGAYRSNIDAQIKNIDDLRTYYDEICGGNPYEEIVRLMDEEGYEFVLGPAAPSISGKIDDSFIGVYCKNYLEIIERQKLKDEENKETKGAR
ncbi:MAG: hypothetical protein HFJ17_00700 [Clostridia bacterium]|nr:hypothetical protein [Clostridia bacterium]